MICIVWRNHIDDPRGWPGDVSDPAEAWLNINSIYHSATWLGRSELESLDKWVREELKETLWKLLELGHLSYIFNFERGWHKAAFKRYSDLRVLFYFDN